MSELTELADVFFNGRPAQKGQRLLSAADVVKRGMKRGTCHVKLDGRIYRVEVKDVTNKVTKIA